MTLSARTASLFLLLAVVACGPAGPTPNTTPPDVNTLQPTAVAPLPNLPIIDADPREGLLALGVGRLLAEVHLRQRPFDDALSKLAFAEYLERLDGGKLFLLASHVEQLRGYSDRMDDQIRAGDLLLARTGAALMIQRRKIVADIVSKVLAQPFDYTKNEELETDSEKRSYVADDQQLADRWRKILKLQALERVTQMEETAEALKKAKDKPDKGDAEAVAAAAIALGKIPPTGAGREKKAREDLANSFSARFTRLDAMDPLTPAATFLNAIATVYDPHTTYMAPAEKANFDIALSGSLEGIGAVLSEKDHYIVVRELVPGGASWRQGRLEAGDLIVAVAQKGKAAVDVADMPIQKVVQMIRGPKGSVVVLTVRKADDRIEVIPITRDVVEVEAAYARGAVLDLGPDHEPVGYVMLPSFYGAPANRARNASDRNATGDVRILLESFRKRRLGGAIIDLRGNGGGLLGHAVDITGLLIKNGPVVQTRYPDGETRVLKDDDTRISFDGEVVMLVDRFSASASEILAGALQDYRRALVVGTGPTHGKGTVQAMVDLDKMRAMPGPDPLGVVKLTIQQYFRVDGDSTQWRGVIPDVVLPDPAAHIESGERELDHSIPWSEIRPLSYQKWPKARWNPKVLAAKSKKRSGKQALFAKIAARSSYLKARREETRVQLNRRAWLDKRKKDDAALDKVDPKLNEGKDIIDVKVVDYAGGKSGSKSPADKKKNGRAEDWIKQLAHDPWVEEAMYLLEDMAQP